MRASVFRLTHTGRRFPLLVGAASALALAGACSSTRVLVPAEGSGKNAATANGATLVATGAPWDADPDDLTDYITPIAVELVNDGPYEVRISYVDFQLIDESGFRYAALNPFVSAQTAESGDASPLVPLAKTYASASPSGVVVPPVGVAIDYARLEDQGVLVAGRFMPAPRIGGGSPVFRGGARLGVPGPAFRPGASYRAAPSYRVAPPLLRPGVRASLPLPSRSFTHGYYGGGWHGYQPAPYYRPWLGVGFTYWDSPFFYPPGYATWVWGWSPSYYPASVPPEDVVSLGVPEGVLQPGGRIDGFLYFQRANKNATRFAFTWDVHEARQNAPLGQNRVDLIAIEQ